MAATSNPDTITPSGEVAVFSSVAALVTAFTAGGTYAGRVTRRVVAMSDGLMKTILAGSGGATVDLVYAANVPEEIQAVGFSATGATLSPSASAPIKVYF